MKIGLYGEPTNSIFSYYRGLYRQNDLIDLYEYDNISLIKEIDRYFSLSNEGGYVEYTETNLSELLLFYRTFKAAGWLGDIILFTDNVYAGIPTDFELLGYDICADSMYYSPIGDGFLVSYSLDEKFFSEMSINDYKFYKENVNDKGLFQTYSAALNFAQYCNTINQKYEHVIESEDNWRPFAIYTLDIRKHK